MSTRQPRWTLPVAIAAAGAAFAGAFGYQSFIATPSSATNLPTLAPVARSPLGNDEANGALPDGVRVFDNRYPGVAKLDPDLLRALRRAATNAAGSGVDFFVESGWRSAQYQERLLQQAIAKYGSRAKAAQWVATPNTSAHVSGDAVDVGHAAAVKWLSRWGARYGLCQIYRNEPWHYELRPAAVNHGCPAMYRNPTHDPRMRS